MHTNIERTWWFKILSSALAALAAMRLMALAGIVTPYHFSSVLLLGFCVFSLQRLIAFAGWLVVLCLPPSLHAVEPKP